MLILTRKPGESIYIGDNVKVTIVEIKGHQIRVGIDAPPELRIYREEIYLQILEENKRAAEASIPDAGLEELSAGWRVRVPGSEGDSEEKRKRAKFALDATQVKVSNPEVVVKRRKSVKSDE